MQIDKKSFDGNVYFNEEKHKYFDKEGNTDFVSVTTIIHSFAQEFNGDFWSSYKALEKVLTPELFSHYKSDWLNTKKINLDKIPELDLTEFNLAKTAILDEWKKSNEDACERGTRIHKERELAITKSNTPDLSILKMGGKIDYNYSYNPSYTKIEKGKIYPEILLYRVSNDKILKIAGQVDLLLVDEDGGVTIIDFKTNKEIKTKSYYNRSTKKTEKMKYPLNNLDDVNFKHYELQLSLYFWLIKKLYPEYYLKGLHLIHYDHKDKQTIYDCEYLEQDVEKMLKFYKRGLEYNTFKHKFDKIKF